VLPGQRRRRGGRGRVAEADGAAGQPERAAGRMVDRVHLAALVQMWVVEDLAGVEHGAARDAGFAQERHDLVLRA
jgi:hypothetical protein